MPWPHAVALLLGTLVLAAPARAWIATIDGSRPADPTVGALALGPSGDVFVAGTLPSPGGRVPLVLKLANDVEVWRRPLDGVTVDGEAPVDLRPDPAGDPIVAGLVDEAGARVLVKLAASSGAERWRAAVAGTRVAFAVDAKGDVVVAAASGRVTKLAGSSGTEMWHVDRDCGAVAIGPAGDPIVAGAGEVARLASSTGAVVWATPTPSAEAMLDYDAATNALHAAGRHQGGYRVARLDAADGAIAWTHDTPGFTDPTGTTVSYRLMALARARDGSGDVFTAGIGTASGSRVIPVPDMLVGRLSATTGAASWLQTIHGTAFPAYDAPSSLVVDAGGDVLLGGWYATRAGATDVSVLKLAGASGAVAWVVPLGYEASYAVAFGVPSLRADARVPVAVDESTVVVAGAVTDDHRSASRLVIARIAATDATVVARYDTTGDGHGSADRGHGIARDANGDLIVCGLTQNVDVPGESGDFTVVKLDGRRGIERWRFTVPEGIAEHVAVDADGYVVAAGARADAKLVVRLAPDGRELWRRESPPLTSDEVTALALGPDGAIYVATDRTREGEGGFVTKLSPDGATDWSVPAIAVATILADPSGDPIIGTRFFADVTKLSGLDGRVRWSVRLAADDVFWSEGIDAVAVDRDTGDVFAAGSTDLGTFVVLRLAAGDGHVRWQRVLQPDLVTVRERWRIALDAAGDVGAAGAGRIVKLAGGDGAVRWDRTLPMPDGHGVADFGLDAAGNPFAVGHAGDGFTVFALHGAAGEARWTHPVVGAAANDVRIGASALVPDDLGGVAAVGTTARAGTLYDVTVVRLGPDGADAWCLPRDAHDAHCVPCSGACDDDDPCTTPAGCDAGGFCAWAYAEGAAGVTCALRRRLAIPACRDTRPPSAIKRRFTSARRLARRAFATKDAGRRAVLLGRASDRLGRALALVDGTARSARRPLDATCRTGVRRLLADARARVDAARE